MKKLSKKSAKYALTLISLAVIIMAVNIKRMPYDLNLINHTAPILNKKNATNMFDGLPCGFKRVGLQDAVKPTFLTNSDIPILQCPAGNYPGTSVQIPDAAYSASQSDQLILQPDGNLVIYCLSCNPGRALWSTQTNGKGGKTLFFQTDGDLVLRNVNGKVIWHSNIRSTCAGSELAYFTLQDDGNLAMLYDESISNGSKTVTDYLGGTATTNDQVKSPHPGKIQ